MKHFLAAALLFASAGVALAEDQRAMSEERAALFEALKTSDNPQIARAATDALWQLWLKAPDENAQTLMDFGMNRMRVFDNRGAIQAFDKLIEYAPDYAEAWNQRAFAKFRVDELDGSLEDIDRALELEPKHFGALSGKFRILMAQGRRELALQTLKRANEVHPWLPERALLGEPL